MSSTTPRHSPAGLPITARLRRRQTPPDGDIAVESSQITQLEPASTAMIICDMWDRHWSRGATERVAALAPRINDLARRLRAQGALIVHAPSDTMDFYRDHPARRWVADLPRRAAPPVGEHVDPPLPIDDSDGGSDTGESDQSPVWTRQHPAIDIASSDAISDCGDEIYSVFADRGIDTVLMTGVHTNMCVLNRSFAIKKLVGWQLRTILVRDLTDAMYNPAMPPRVSHDRGTELVVEHIETYWCPSTLSTDLLSTDLQS